MIEPVFLSVEQVKLFHWKGLEHSGGLEGIRDKKALESAVMQPQNVYYYGSRSVFEVAAAYCYHIAESQAFIDGNKRTGVIAGLTFLELNGISIKFDSRELYKAMIEIANGRMDKTELSKLLQKLTK